jgi:hypothetical protein
MFSGVIPNMDKSAMCSVCCAGLANEIVHWFLWKQWSNCIMRLPAAEEFGSGQT